MLKYEKVALDISNMIIEKGLKAGDKLPSISELMEMYDVSKSTIVKVLALLEEEAVIYQARGSGIYVRNKKRDGYISLFTTQGFSTDLSNHNITSKVIEFKECLATDDVKMQLKLEDNSTVYKVKRLRYLDGKTLCIETSYFNKEIVLFLNKELVEGSIFNYLKDNLKVKIGFSDIYSYVTKLNEKDASLLELEKGDPCYHVEQIFYTSTGIPFDYSHLKFNYLNSQFYTPGR